jgi:hypothetical protein
MLEPQEVQKIMNYLLMSKRLFDKSTYKYGAYKQLLKEIYPRYNDYRIKKIFDELLKMGHIFKVPSNKSFLYQFNSHIDMKEYYKDKTFILYFD